ncbi:MAG: hypothetical protein JXP48_01835 [Acidobacteria bacterium]|nr:hypothetical protein [Acidobacteriota bacterium]
MKLEKYSIGIGDRFGCQGAAQLVALEKAAARGLPLVPVWNKSEREHIIGDHVARNLYDKHIVPLFFGAE